MRCAGRVRSRVWLPKVAFTGYRHPGCRNRRALTVSSGIIEPKRPCCWRLTTRPRTCCQFGRLGWLLVVTVPAGLVILIELGIIIGHKRGSMPPANLGAVAPAAVLILMGLLKLI